MGKFFNGKIKKDRSTLIKYSIIAVGIFIIILLFILISIKNSKKPKANIDIKDELIVEINDDWPEKEDFFDKIENYSIDLVTVDYNDFDVTEVGEYTVTVDAEGITNKKVNVKVVDTTAPTLILKEVKIPLGMDYKIDDFIDICSDNSGKECTYEYYTGMQDAQGNPIDYSSFTQEDTYIIKIYAYDESGNQTEVQDTKLTIGDGGTIYSDCTYGDLSVDITKVSYPIAVIVGSESLNCALDASLWNDERVQVSVNNLYMKDYENLKTELKAIFRAQNRGETKVVAYPHYIAVLNKQGTGLVGYAIYVKVYIVDKNYSGQIDTNDNLAISYYINSDGTRKYETNTYDLK